MEQILGKNCNQIFSGAPYRVQKDQGHLITSVFGIRGTVPGTKSSGALWILLTHPNSGHGRETQNIGCTIDLIQLYFEVNIFWTFLTPQDDRPTQIFVTFFAPTHFEE